MSAPAPSRRTGRFFVGFLLVALAVAGGLSHLASSAPDGLDTVTLQGCEVVAGEVVAGEVAASEEAGGEELAGTCIAQHARPSATADSPLADYALAGAPGTVGLAGVLGVLVTLVVAGGLFWGLRRRGPGPDR